MRTLATSLILLCALFSSLPAAAQVCVTCWNAKCPDLASYVRKCDASSGEPKAKGGKKSPAAPSEHPKEPEHCPDGQSITPDTEGHCCWSGQSWADGHCIGVPTSCPEGLAPNAAGNACAPPECADGESRTADHIHCCFPGQAWNKGRKSCVGIPSSCPTGQAAEGETCLPPLGEKDVGTEINGNGDAIYGGEGGYDPNTYLGRVSHGARLLLLDRHVAKDQFGLDIIKVRVLTNGYGDEVGKVGWVGLKDTSFKDHFDEGSRTTH